MKKDLFRHELNHLLVSTYQTIEKAEQKSINKGSAVRVSIAEIHLIEAVGRGKGPKTISALAARLGITLASVTVGVNKLVKKGLLQKKRSDKDGRVMCVTLTPAGRRIYRRHEEFHAYMVDSAISGLTQEEKYVMLKGIQKLREFFAAKLEV